ncbi:MAG TPA: SRPBCC family protein [Solirubrobacterales bacterium]|nr:SRPBCC family protein [Solirubrobacterales bacterium]
MADLARMSQTALKEASKATSKDGPLSDPKKLAVAGVGLVALPVALEQIAKRVAPKVSELGGEAKDKLSDVASDTASSVGDQAKQAAKSAVASKVPGLSDDGEGEGLLSKLTPGSSGEGEGLLSKITPGSSDDDDDGDSEGRAAPGQGGSGRRMPIQQSVDVAVPIKIAYNRWTQFEDWPDFMHRVESVDQADDTTISVSIKVWGLTRRFEAEIQEQRPDERIEWNVSEGLSHTGVVTFHELAPRLTRVEVSLDFEPQGMLEKMGRGMRFAKRAVRGDLHRFKAIVELDEEAEGGWRGTIEDGEVKRRTERKSSGSRSRSSSRNGSSRKNGSSSRSRSKSRSGSRSKSS